MNAPQVTCSKCRVPIPEDSYNLPGAVACPGCGSELLVEVFPALYRPIARGRSGDAVIEASESSCFYHPDKKAVLPCDACGRFLCALCDCELNGQHLCPGCLETGRVKGKIKSLQNRRTLYDSLALSLALWPVVIFPFIYFTVVTAPIALYLAIRHWNTPTSVVHRTKIRFVLAIILAGLEVCGWGVVIVMLMMHL